MPMMSQPPFPSPASPSQLLVLQSLLQAGHRPIRLRPRSLVHWGLAFAFLAMTTVPLLRLPQWEGRNDLQALVAMLWLGIGLGTAAVMDWRANQRAASRAQETLPFVQGQVTKVWWLLLAAGVLYTGSTFFFGGAYQTYMVWVALIGLGLFIHGLFSQELVEWAGASIFLLALLALTSGLPLAWHRPIIINISGVGLPLLGWMLHRWPQARQATGPLMARVSAFMLASVLPALVVVQCQARWALPDDIPIYTQAELARLGPPSQWPHHLGLHLQAGTTVDFELEMQGEVLKTRPGAARLSYTVMQDIDVLLVDGQPSHYVRWGGGPWEENKGWLRITQLDFTPDLTRAAGLLVRGRAHVTLGGLQ